MINIWFSGEKRLDRTALRIDFGVPAAIFMIDMVTVQMCPKLVQP